MTTLSDIERLALRLDAMDLGDADRATLRAVFALAGQAVAGAGDEVSGFGTMPPDVPGSSVPGFEYGGMADGSCFQSFQWGVGRSAGGAGGVQPIDY